MATPTDYGFMARALELARRGLYSTDPNPRVGCVIVSAGQIVGEGWHERAGEPHAEVHALRSAGDKARGATAYVTLEPCSHHGRTPPCADALIEAGIARVVIGAGDANPQVAGQGTARLKAAGIAIESGVMAGPATALNAGFLKRMSQGRPLVRLKLAVSLDGRTAMASGESQWITGPQARSDVQRLRARSSAIVTGIGTVLADNPSLNVRPQDMGELGAACEPGRQPLRVILDSRLQLDPKARVIGHDGRCVVLTGSAGAEQRRIVGALVEAGARVQSLSSSRDQPDLRSVLEWLAAADANEILVEAGPTLAGAFLEQRLVDELWVYQAPTLLGSDARPMAVMPLQRMTQQMRLQRLDQRRVGEDLRTVFALEAD